MVFRAAVCCALISPHRHEFAEQTQTQQSVSRLTRASSSPTAEPGAVTGAGSSAVSSTSHQLRLPPVDTLVARTSRAAGGAAQWNDAPR